MDSVGGNGLLITCVHCLGVLVTDSSTRSGAFIGAVYDMKFYLVNKIFLLTFGVNADCSVFLGVPSG